MAKVFIGVDPHKLSATIEVVDEHEKVLATGRFGTDKAGYAAMRKYVASLARAGLGGRGQQRRRPSAGAAAARRRRAGRRRAGEARGPGPAVRHRPQPQDRRPRRARGRGGRGPHQGPAGAALDGELEALRMLADRREELTRRRVQTVNRLQALLAELLPGQAKRDITTGQAKAMLAWSARATSPARPAAGSPPRSWPSWSRSRPRSRRPPPSSRPSCSPAART